MSRSGINIISQSPKFAQIPKGLSQIFKIVPKDSIELEDVEIQLYDDIVYYGKYLNAVDLRTFLYLSFILSTNRKKAQLFKSSDNLKVEKYPSNKHIVRVPVLKQGLHTTMKGLLNFFDLKMRLENKVTVLKSLCNLSDSYIQTKTFKSKLFLHTHDELLYNPAFASLFKTNFTNHSLTPKFYSLTTIKMDVVKQLSKSNINKLIIYYYLCDNVDFKQQTILPMYQISSLWLKDESNRKTRNFRKKFLRETLKEIQQLSKEFRFEIDNLYITVRRGI
jgi:hypothetical protein